MTREISHFIGGKLTAGRSGRKAPVYNPATGDVAAEVALASTQEAREAVAIAKAAAPASSTSSCTSSKSASTSSPP